MNNIHLKKLLYNVWIVDTSSQIYRISIFLLHVNIMFGPVCVNEVAEVRWWSFWMQRHPSSSPSCDINTRDTLREWSAAEIWDSTSSKSPFAQSKGMFFITSLTERSSFNISRFPVAVTDNLLHTINTEGSSKLVTSS